MANSPHSGTPTSSVASPSIEIITDLSFIKSFNRGPITTLSSLPASCTDVLTSKQNGKRIFFAHWDDPYFDASCFPTGSLHISELVAASWESYYYSPAICPDGWTIGSTFHSSVPGHNPSIYISLGSETVAGCCCPSNYTYAGAGHACTSVVTKDQRISYVQATNIGASRWDRGPTTTTTMASESTIWGNGVQVWWQDSDLAVFASSTNVQDPHPQSPLSTSSTGALVLPVSTPKNNNNGAGELPRNVAIGVSVSVTLALITGFTVVLFFLRHRRKHSKVCMNELGMSESVQEPPGKSDLTEPYSFPAELHINPAKLYTYSMHN